MTTCSLCLHKKNHPGNKNNSVLHCPVEIFRPGHEDFETKIMGDILGKIGKNAKKLGLSHSMIVSQPDKA